MLAIFGVVQAASLACYIEGARLLPASRTALLSTADVPLAPIWVWLAFGEVPARLSVLGGTLVLASVVWDTTTGSRGSLRWSRSRLSRRRHAQPIPETPRDPT